MLLAIARQCGVYGDETGRLLAAKYNIPFYDKTTVHDLAKKSGMYEKYEAFYAEAPVNTFLFSLVLQDSEEILNQTPEKALPAVIPDRDFVIMGRCAGSAYRKRPDLVRIFLYGDRDRRIRNVMEKYGMNEKKAAQRVDTVDRRRSEYCKFYSGETWNSAVNYDLCLKATDFTPEQTADIIETVLRRLGRS